MINQKFSSKDFDKEIRDIYHERNSKVGFKKPTLGNGGLLVSHVLWIVIVMLVSLTTTLAVASWYLATSFNIIPDKVNRVTVAADAPVSEVATKLAPSSVVVFTKHNIPNTWPVWQQVYLIKQALGHGVVLSSDGWLVTSAEVVTDLTRNYVVATADGLLRPVELIVKDSAAPFIYLKVKANNLAVAAFVRQGEVEAGESVISLAATEQVVGRTLAVRKVAALTAFSSATTTGLIQSSELITDRYSLDNPLPNGFLGAPVVSLNGKIIGLVGKNDGLLTAIYPLDTLDTVIDTLFINHQLSRPVLGVQYVSLVSTLPYTLNQGDLPTSGALLVSRSGQPAVVANSPAAKAGLKENDVITHLAGERVNGLASLSYLLNQYRPGSNLTLKVWRQGSEREIVVILGQKET
ncbi:MAG: S1C family serine protease, partial [Patescibacteria group bacterium]